MINHSKVYSRDHVFKNCEEKELSCTIDENINCCNSFGKFGADSLNIKYWT